MKPPITKAKVYLKVRQQNTRKAMKRLGLDGLLLTHGPDLGYLTNFSGNDSVGLLTEKDFFLISDFRYQELAQQEAGWLDLVIRQGRMAEALAQTIKRSGALKIGFEANFTTFGQVDAIVAAMKELKLAPLPELIPLEDVMLNLRKVKDDNEIDLVRRAVQIAEEAFDAVRGEIHPGQTENHLAGLLILELRSRGASDVSFPPIVAAGANSSLPHYCPSETTLASGQPLLIDFGCMYRGYCSDLTRTMLVGRIAPKIKDIYKLVYEANQAAIGFLRPGITTMQADQVAREIIERGGYGKYFGHGLGHGLGREVHELPNLRKSGPEEELRPGMIVTVEPGIYLPGVGGVRIEDDVLITHSGCEVLSTLDRELEACHIQ